MPLTYRIKLVHGDSQFEAEGDKKFVLDMVAAYGGNAAPASRGTPLATEQPKVKGVPALPSSPGKKVSAGEFIRQLGFKKHTDIVLAFGYYLERVSGLTSFTPADINTCYYEAKLESSNTSQMIIQNMRTGRMMAAHKATAKGKRAYVLTRTGEEFMENRPAKPAK
jgi:hypothetical protein